MRRFFDRVTSWLIDRIYNERDFLADLESLN
jgi:hypothetical protein